MDLTKVFIPRGVQFAALPTAGITKRDQGEIRIGYQVHFQPARNAYANGEYMPVFVRLPPNRDLVISCFSFAEHT